MAPPAGTTSRLPVAAAILFGIVTLAYAAVWTFYAHRPGLTAYLGVEISYEGLDRAMLLRAVTPGAPAARAGLRAGDRIVAVEGRPLDSPYPFNDHVTRGKPGQAVRFTVERKGSPPSDVQVVLGERPARYGDPAPTLLRRVAFWPLRSYPVPFVVVGLAVLLLRLRDRNAWLLAVSFAGLGVGPPEAVEPFMHPDWRAPLLAYSYVANGLAPACFYWLLATFPARSAVDRRAPWLKGLLLGLGAALWIPVAASVLVTGSLFAAVRSLTPRGLMVIQLVNLACYFTAVALGVLSLLLNCRTPASADAGRRARFMAWSFTIGLLSWAALMGGSLALGRELLDLPFWFWVPCALLMMTAPVLFGYAVVRHRVLEFSLLVRRSARYVLVQRGFVLLAVVLSVVVTWLFVTAIARVLPRLTDAAVPAGIAAGTVFGLLLVRTGGAVAGRVTRRIDRAFFRSAYDARVILEELAQKTALVTSRERLVELMAEPLAEALHPRTLAVYLRDSEGRLTLASPPTAGGPASLDGMEDLTARLEREGQPHDVTTADRALGAVAPLEADCLVPVLSRQRTLIGLLVLGVRLSEEPYSREDKRLLASIANQIGGALEHLILAEEMAGRIEAERRAEREMQVAAEVQRRLFPAHRVPTTTIEYAARCVQAREVGGDYYDFLDLGARQIGLVLADISGKGLYASLLMANLQASLRSLAAGIGAGDLPRLLDVVNRSFFASTAGNHFATMFVGRYDDVTRQLRYANCGHHPPVLVRAGGAVERLGVTARAVGLFEELDAAASDVALACGDLLAVFSDGVTEAMSPQGEEFGEARLLDVLVAHQHCPVAEAIERTIEAVRAFGGPVQSDDVTLMLIRGR